MQENNINFTSFYNIGIWQTQFNKTNSKDLIEKCYQIKKEFPTVSKSNINGYQSESNLHTNPLFFSLVKLLNNINLQITNYPNNRISDMWVNISPRHSLNHKHNHGHDIHQLSGVMYLKVPKNSGDLYFYNPLNTNHVNHYQPTEGEILIFSQALSHSVGPNLSEEDRISIAFNYE